jgi:hypothetical protein
VSAGKYIFKVLVTAIRDASIGYLVGVANLHCPALVVTAANRMAPARLESWRCGSNKSQTKERGNQYDWLHLGFVGKKLICFKEFKIVLET